MYRKFDDYCADSAVLLVVWVWRCFGMVFVVVADVGVKAFDRLSSPEFDAPVPQTKNIRVGGSSRAKLMTNYCGSGCVEA